ncbi:MAG: hypothetical protein PHR77_06265 [Kiritimatiellae bacterium]|nr:hypothetical protein [Kiritimatiellia bacterium]MDD5521512.1 hypothetical protein [Kiritimatiellia bacterium]
MKVLIKITAVIAIIAWVCSVFAQVPVISKVVEDAFKRSESICREVEKIRILKFKNKVITEVQSKEDFKKFVKKSVDEQYGDENANWYVKALVKMGVLEKDMDLTATLIKILEGQAAAHYDPETKKCNLLITDMDPLMLDLVLSHELYHALQDQYFNLYDFILKDVKAMRDNGDAMFGKQCLVEGDATLVMMAWMVIKQGGITDPALADPMVSMAINMQGAMDYDTIMNMAENSATASLGGLTASIKDMKDLPRYFMESIYATYIQGAMMVNFVKTKGGWNAVGDLYKNPPQSTEQVLHPEKLSGQRDLPVDVRLPELKTKLSEKWLLGEEDVLGELGIKILLEIWANKESRDPVAISTAAAGWGGDRYYFLTNNETGKDLLVWKTVWDTPQDAGEFVTAYRMILSSRFPKMRKAGQSNPGDKFMYQIWEIEPGRFLKLVRQDQMVGIIDSTDRSCLDIMWQ